MSNDDGKELCSAVGWVFYVLLGILVALYFIASELHDLISVIKGFKN